MGFSKEMEDVYPFFKNYQILKASVNRIAVCGFDIDFKKNYDNLKIIEIHFFLFVFLINNLSYSFCFISSKIITLGSG